MAPSEREVRLLDSQILPVLDDDSPDYRGVLVLPGVPGSRSLDGGRVRNALRGRLHLIEYDQPGDRGPESEPR